MIARCACDGCPACVDHFPTPGPCSRAIRQPAALCEPCAGPVPVWYHFDSEYTPAPGRWPARVSCCATGPLAAARKMRRAFPPERGSAYHVDVSLRRLYLHSRSQSDRLMDGTSRGLYQCQ